MPAAATTESLAGIFELERFTAAGAEPGTPPEVLLEVPHGATRKRHFEATRRRLVGDYPDELEQFFYVNTDVGAVECARWAARMATRPERFDELRGLLPRPAPALSGALVLRGLVARTFVDCNRVIDGGPSGRLRDGLTPGLPGYVNNGEDVETLKRMHADYQAAAARAYEEVCGAGGTAVIVHTYAPRSIRLERVDDGIVAALRRAYDPAVYDRWERRPAVDLITETAAGERLAPEKLAAAVQDGYHRIDIQVEENSTYRLHPATMGYLHSARYPGRVLCLELDRTLLAERYTPFAEMTIDDAKARRMAAPLAAALLRREEEPG